MLLRLRNWLSLAPSLIALVLLQCAPVCGDADFESVRVLMKEDSSGRAGDPPGKYWRKYKQFLFFLARLTSLTGY